MQTAVMVSSLTLMDVDALAVAFEFDVLIT